MVAFSEYTPKFLEKSWIWLNDSEIKEMTMTPDFTREGQREWFSSLPGRKDYLIWGVLWDEVPIGVCGLKNINGLSGEYWGYIGEKEYWGRGIGSGMMSFVEEKASALGLSHLYLYVSDTNSRAVRLYEKNGFIIDGEGSTPEKILMVKSI